MFQLQISKNIQSAYLMYSYNYNLNYCIAVVMNHWIGSNSPEDTIDGLRQFLPEVEQQLRKEIQPELQQQFDIIIHEQIAKIERQAETEFQAALEVLQSEMGLLKYQKLSQLETELSQLKLQKEEREKIRLAQAQQRFIQEHFDDRVLGHPAMQQLQHGLQSEIAEQMRGRYESVREKRVKQLKVRLQSREQKERVYMDKSIRSEIYSKSGLDELKQEIGRFKISLASLKSKYNLKITKITSEIKELSKKCQETGYSNSYQLIQQLQREISELKTQVQSNHQKEVAQEESSFYFNQRGNNFSLADNLTKNTFFQPTTNHQSGNKYIDGAQYINQDIDIDSDDSLDEMTSSERKAQEQIPPPPNSRDQMLKRLLIEEKSKKDEGQFEDDRNQVYLEMPMKSLLQFNVAKMLRQQWQEDSFDRYLSLRSTKENNMNAQNQQSQNNFQTLYEQHLKRLNRDSKVPKMKKLTEKAKQQISLNFASQRHRNTDSYF